MSIKNLPINLSCSLSPNILDWIRSIYFSLFGSSMLTFVLKVYSLEGTAMVSFIIGVLCFFVGLLMSLTIANRFKNYEKLYDIKPDKFKLENSINEYYYQKETEGKEKQNSNYLIHLLFFVIWLPAILTIGYAGLSIEKKSSDSSNLLKNKITHIDSIIVIKENIEKLESENDKLKKSNIILESKNDSLIKLTKELKIIQTKYKHLN